MTLFIWRQALPQLVAEVEQESHMWVAFLLRRWLVRWKYREPLSVGMEGVWQRTATDASRGPLAYPVRWMKASPAASFTVNSNTIASNR
jgi:hypothetical protein